MLSSRFPNDPDNEYAEEPVALELCNGTTPECPHYTCPDGWHAGNYPNCSCTPDCAYEGRMTTRFVEYEIDQPGPPISYFVNATDEQAEWILRLLQHNTETWQEPWIGPVKPLAFDEFRRQMIEDNEWEDPDAPAPDAGLDVD